MHNIASITASRTAVMAAVVAALICLLTLSGCFGISSPPRVAATVNGSTIDENQITSFIEEFRKNNTQYETDIAWAEFLRNNGFTPESMRTYVISTVFIPKMIIRQECAARGIEVSDTALDTVIAREKKYYEERYGENSWDSVLASFGYDEQSWRQNELDRLLEEQLIREVIGTVTPSAHEIQQTADTTASTYNGKNSYYLSFDSQEQAQNAKGSLTEPVTLAMFSTLGTPVYAGWNSISATRDLMSKEYIQALNALSPGQVSEPTYESGKWLLIFCESAFSVESSTGVVLGDIPEEIYAQIVNDATTAKEKKLFNEWVAECSDASDIVIEPMPRGLPYDVNVALNG